MGTIEFTEQELEEVRAAPPKILEKRLADLKHQVQAAEKAIAFARKRYIACYDDMMRFQGLVKTVSSNFKINEEVDEWCM